MNDEKKHIISSKPEISLKIMDKEILAHNPFRETFDSQFWQLVSDLYQDGEGQMSWAAALTEVRVQRITEHYETANRNVIVGLLEDVYDKFYQQIVELKQEELLPSFVQQLTEICTSILNKDYETSNAAGKKGVYSKLLKCIDGSKMTALHMVADRNLSLLGQHIINLYPSQCYVKSSGPVGKKIALEFSLENKMDEISSVLVKNMLNERVRHLFEYDEAIGRCKFSFSNMAGDIHMKETVLAILDCLINSDYPFVPVPPGEDKEQAWSKIPDLPMRYHVYYRLLDGDQYGRPARVKLENGEYIVNKDFDHMSPSGLYLIANSPFNDDIIGHPAVRLLVERKWQMYGAKKIRLRAVLHLIFLLVMTLAFFLPADNNDRTLYDNKVAKFRGVCEVVMYVVSFCYLISECNQMLKEKMVYLKDPFNYLDLLGILLVIVLIPVKWLSVNLVKDDPSLIEWSLASVIYLINILRILKYFPAFKTTGVYSKTFADILYKDITKFLSLYLVVMWAFAGSLILAVSSRKTGLEKANMTKLHILLQEVRALTEGAGFADSYIGNFRTGIIILLMINMFLIIVVLTNILIGQLSYRYEQALTNAHVQYDIDKTKIVTKIENSRFRKLNQRIDHYVDGAYISETAMVDGLLEDWKMLKNYRNRNDVADLKSVIKDIVGKKSHF